MRVNGLRGVVRRKVIRTTEADPVGSRAADLVDRNFRVPAPNLLVVADFTYVRLASGGFVYTAFVVDAFAGPDRELGMFDQQTIRVRGVSDPPGGGLAGAPGTSVDRVHDSSQRRRVAIHLSEMW